MPHRAVRPLETKTGLSEAHDGYGAAAGRASRAAARVRPNSGFTPTRFFYRVLSLPREPTKWDGPSLIFQIHSRSLAQIKQDLGP